MELCVELLEEMTSLLVEELLWDSLLLDIGSSSLVELLSVDCTGGTSEVSDDVLTDEL